MHYLEIGECLSNDEFHAPYEMILLVLGPYKTKIQIGELFKVTFSFFMKFEKNM